MDFTSLGVHLHDEFVRERTLISSIQVERLFGTFDYQLKLFDGLVKPSDRVSIIYGDNGCGKTTILKLLFHLLSPVNRKGHKTVLSKIPFRSFSVCLSDGTRIVADRGRRYDGPEYRVIFSAAGRPPLASTVNGELQRSPENEQAFELFLDRLKGLGLDLVFVRDNRWVTSSLDDSEAGLDEPIHPGPQAELELLKRKSVTSARSRIHGETVRENLMLVTDYFRRNTLGANSRGEIDTNNVFASVIQNLVRTPKELVTVERNEIHAYRQRLETLSEKNGRFAELKLTVPFDFTPLIEAIENAPIEKRYALVNVLKPFLEVLDVRLNALTDIHLQITRFVDALNSFLFRKHVMFDLYSGLVIQGETGPISPEWLSSGERQLVLLFCRTVLAENNVTFLIDEPEISLNVKWQRLLIEKLLKCTEGTTTQFLLASHSIELMAQYPDRVTSVRQE